MVLSCDELPDDKLVAKLRSCFSYASTMNEAREQLRSMGQSEHKSVSVYIYRWRRALYRSSGICPENEASSCHQGLHLITEEKYQKQNHQQVGRNETATKYCPKGLQAGE